MNLEARTALAALAVAAADYESAYRLGYGRHSDAPLDRSAVATSLQDAHNRVEAAYADLAEHLGPDAARAIRVSLIFAAARTQNERMGYGENTPGTVRRAILNPDLYA